MNVPGGGIPRDAGPCPILRNISPEDSTLQMNKFSAFSLAMVDVGVAP